MPTPRPLGDQWFSHLQMGVLLTRPDNTPAVARVQCLPFWRAPVSVEFASCRPQRLLTSPHSESQNVSVHLPDRRSLAPEQGGSG
jgi:hypothetical protein